MDNQKTLDELKLLRAEIELLRDNIKDFERSFTYNMTMLSHSWSDDGPQFNFKPYVEPIDPLIYTETHNIYLFNNKWLKMLRNPIADEYALINMDSLPDDPTAALPLTQLDAIRLKQMDLSFEEEVDFLKVLFEKDLIIFEDYELSEQIMVLVSNLFDESF